MENELKKLCAYCEMHKRTTKVWEQTNELVCYDCRENMLHREFEAAFPPYTFWARALADGKETKEEEVQNV